MSNASDPCQRYFQKLGNKGFWGIEAERTKNKNRHFGGENSPFCTPSEKKMRRENANRDRFGEFSVVRVRIGTARWALGTAAGEVWDWEV